MHTLKSNSLKLALCARIPFLTVRITNGHASPLGPQARFVLRRQMLRLSLTFRK